VKIHFLQMIVDVMTEFLGMQGLSRGKMLESTVHDASYENPEASISDSLLLGRSAGRLHEDALRVST
jgi:hypothetical protein